MAKSIYNAINTYAIYAEDTAWGTPGTPSASAYLDKVTSISLALENNTIKSQGIGDGRNATTAMNGAFGITGNASWELTDPAFLQYCFIGAVTGAGNAESPYIITEAEGLGYAAGQVNTLTIEVGKDSGSNDDTLTANGMVVDDFEITGAVNDVVKVTANFTGRSVASATTVETYAGPANRPFTFVDASVSVGSDTVAEVTAFSIRCNNNIQKSNAFNSRFLSLPLAGKREYEFSMTMKLHYDNTSSILSGLEARGLFFNGSTGTAPEPTSDMPAVAVSLDLVEGAGDDDRVVNFDFENCYFTSYSEPVELDNGYVEIEISGVALSGVSNIPCTWWTI